MTKILMLSTWPIYRTINFGGPQRLKAIKDFYEKQGAIVKYVGVIDQNHLTSDIETGKTFDFIVAPSEVQAEINAHPSLGNVIIGQACSSNSQVFQALAKNVRDFDPDVIQLEHPSLWPFIDRLGIGKVKLIYSAHQVDWQVKQGLYQDIYGSDPSQMSRSFEVLKTLGHELVARADLVFTASDADRDYFEKIRPGRVFLAPNGTSRLSFREKDKLRWRSFLDSQFCERTFLFASSANVENFKGFIDYIGTRLGFLPPHAKVIVVGEVCTLIRRTEDYRKSPGAIGARFCLLDARSENDLTALIEVADCFLSPVPEASAALNFKRALFLSTGKPIIASTRSLHSFARVNIQSNVTIANSKVEFQQAMTKFCDYGVENITAGKKGLEWEDALGEFKRVINLTV